MAVTSVVLFFGALLVTVLTAAFDRRRVVLHLYSCFWAQLYFYVNPFWRLQIEGRNRLPWNSGAVLVANHQSLADIPVLFGLYRPFKWVSKASVFRVPFIGWNMSLNQYVSLVRGNPRSIADMLEDCRNWLARGAPILMFPEGTRSDDGEVKAFKKGAFQLAVDCDVPVFPIVITGTSQTLPKYGYVFSQRAQCRVRVLPPVHPRQFDGDVDALREHVRSLIVLEKARMEGRGDDRMNDRKPPTGDGGTKLDRPPLPDGATRPSSVEGRTGAVSSERPPLPG